MASDVSSGGSSEFLSAKRFFHSSKSQSKEVVDIFVEDEFDTLFWRYYFEKYDPSKIYKIRTLKNEKQTLCGKESLLSYIDLSSLGPNKLIAIDSDYDYLLDNYHSYTSDIRNNKYVVHTGNSYSIENIKMIPSLLRDAVYKLSLCSCVIEDIEHLFRSFSNLYYDLFVLHLFSVNQKDNVYDFKLFEDDLDYLDIDNNLIIKDSTIAQVSDCLEKLRLYKTVNSEEFAKFEKLILLRGVNIENCWQFMKGHCVFEKIGLRVLEILATKYRSEYLSSIPLIKDKKVRKDKHHHFINVTNIDGKSITLRKRCMQLLYDNSPCMECDMSERTLSIVAAAFQ